MASDFAQPHDRIYNLPVKPTTLWSLLQQIVTETDLNNGGETDPVICLTI